MRINCLKFNDSHSTHFIRMKVVYWIYKLFRSFLNWLHEKDVNWVFIYYFNLKLNRLSRQTSCTIHLTEIDKKYLTLWDTLNVFDDELFRLLLLLRRYYIVSVVDRTGDINLKKMKTKYLKRLPLFSYFQTSRWVLVETIQESSWCWKSTFFSTGYMHLWCFLIRLFLRSSWMQSKCQSIHKRWNFSGFSVNYTNDFLVRLSIALLTVLEKE